MNSKIGGVPLVLIALIVVITALVNIPSALFHAQNQEQFDNARNRDEQMAEQLRQLTEQRVIVTEAPVVTVSPTRVPTKAIQRVSSQSGVAR